MRLSVLARLLCITAIVGVGLVAGCATSPVTPTPEPVTIRYGGIDADNPQYASLIDEFHQLYPHITIEILEHLESVDVGLVPVLAMSEVIHNGHVIPLDPYIEGDQRFVPDRFLPGTMEMLRHEGRLWGLPASIDPFVLYYNKDLFDAAGVSYPEPRWTWDDLIIKAAALTNPAHDVYGYASEQEGAFDLHIFIVSQGGGFVDNLTNPTRPTFNHPLNAEAITRWLGLALTHGVVATDISSQEAVYANKAAMWTSRFSDRGGGVEDGSSSTWPAPWLMRWGVAPVPRGTTPISIAMMDVYAISAETAHPDAAWLWIAFLSERAAHQAAPARIEVLHSEEYDRLVGRDVAEMVRGVLEDVQFISPRVFAYGAAFEVFIQQMQQYFIGAITIDEALEATQREAEQIRLRSD
jgi:multiple sugar transport system substrate-binding protein